jgi:hypothetical protein
MKNLLALYLCLAAVVAIAQVNIPLDQPTTVQEQVTVTQNVTVSAVPVQSITFDMVNQKAFFRIGLGNGGNRTVVLDGADYLQIRNQFLAPFGTVIAPKLREKLNAAPGGP